MEEIGQTLREAREQLGITLEEAERATRIRTHHLAALERGEIDELPSPVQVRGFLGNYADFLGLDADRILLQYAEKLQSRRVRKKASPATSLPSASSSVEIRSRRPRWLSFDLFFAALVTLGVIAVLIWGGSRLMASVRRGGQETEAALEFLIPTQTSTVSPSPTSIPSSDASQAISVIPSPASITPTQPLVLGLTSEVNLRIVADKRAWVLVRVDGEEAFRGRLVPGDERSFTGQQVIEITTGNGAGVRVFYNGQDQGLLGDVGQVVIRLWSLDGVLTPTPTQTHTPTASPPATSTAPATATPPPVPGVGP